MSVSFCIASNVPYVVRHTCVFGNFRVTSNTVSILISSPPLDPSTSRTTRLEGFGLAMMCSQDESVRKEALAMLHQVSQIYIACVEVQQVSIGSIW